MLIITLILTIGIQTVTFATTAPILNSLKSYKLVNTYVISNTKNGSSQSLINVKTKIVLGSDLNSPYMINVSDYKSSRGTITKDEKGVYILTDVMSSIAPNSSYSIDIERTFITGTIDYNVNKYKITSDYSEFNNYSDYLNEDIGIEVNNAKIQAKAKSLTQNIVNPYDKAFSIFKFVTTSMTYKLGSPYANKGALSALTYKEGVCEDYAKLFVALCRASGIPARTVSGYRNNGDRINNTFDLTDASHMWAEVYLPSYGWTIAEPTLIFSSGSSIPDATLMRYFGKAQNTAEHIAIVYKNDRYLDNVAVNWQYNTEDNDVPTVRIKYNTMLHQINTKSASLIVTATIAVMKAEDTILQTDLDSANILVNNLANSIDKTNLTARLNSVLSDINIIKIENQKVIKATTITLAAKQIPTRDNYDKALALVVGLKDGVNKTTLQAQLNVILKNIEDAKARSKFPELSDSPSFTTEDTKKVWNVKLNQVIDTKTVNTYNISMKNSKGQLIDIKVSCNEKTLSISPINKFEVGEQYAVYISDKVLNMNRDGIKNGYYFTFEVK